MAAGYKEIPTRLTNFNLIYKGSEFVNAIKTIELPKLEYLQEEVSGAGLSGNIAISTPGHTSALTMSVNFRTFSEQNLKFGETEDFTFKGSFLYTDTETHKVRNVPCSIATKMHRKDTTLGNAEVAKETGSGVVFNVTYLKIEVEGKNVREVDKLNFVDSTDGVDVLAEIRSQIGL